MLRRNHLRSLLAALLTIGAASTALAQEAKPGAAPTAPAAPGAPATPTAPPVPDATAQPGKRGAEVRYGVSPALPRKAGTLRLAAYNVENLFDGADDPALSGEFDDLKMATSDDRCRALADAIREARADVLCLQEMESLEALRWFRDTYLADMGYDYMASDDVGYYRGVEQSVLSRHPIVRQRVWPDADLASTLKMREGEEWTSAREDQGEKFQRSPLFAQVRTPEGYVLDVFVVHHKAGGKEFAFHREAEALQIISFVKDRLAEDPHARIAVLGDFNATPNEKSVKLYMDPNFGGLANAYDERFDINRPRDTYVTHSSGRPIDYIFTSPALREDLVPKSFFVLATLTPAAGWNWRTDPPPPGYASDHRPIIVDIEPRATEARPAASETKLWNAKPGAPRVPGAKQPAAPETKSATPSR